jgi:hypothetical protein
LANDDIDAESDKKDGFFKPVRVEIIDIPKIYHYNDKLFDEVFL